MPWQRLELLMAALYNIAVTTVAACDDYSSRLLWTLFSRCE